MTLDKAIPINWSLDDLTTGPHWRGAIDLVSPSRIFGWIISADHPLHSVEIEVLLLGEKLLSTTSCIFRGDIAKILRQPVKSGFDVSMDDCLPAAAATALQRLRQDGRTTAPMHQVFQLRVAGTPAVIPFSPNVADRPLDLRALAARLAALTDRASGGILSEGAALLAQPLPNGPGGQDLQVIAYYLPQFHPFPENDRWWGTGFTEWTNVTAAKPLFDGHHQPQLPADLGFYDLRLDQVQADQIALARSYGVTGFCYYYYWFGGKTLMTLPIDRHLEQGFDFDFCLCWANESWSRRWDGSESDVLIAQPHSFETDVAFIRSCLKYFHSDRYIKIDGAPLLQVYRINLLENPVETIRRWRDIVREAGFPDLHISMVESVQSGEPHSQGCDSSTQFPPLRQKLRAIDTEVSGLDPGFSGKIFSYPDIVQNELARAPANWLRFRTAMPSWDNTARRGLAAHIYHGSTPDLFGVWMRHLIDEALSHHPAGRRMVFVNAWNEWAEGAHLEPDRRYGHAWLNALRDALSPTERALAPLRAVDGPNHPLAEAARHVAALQSANRALSALIHQTRSDTQRYDVLPFIPVPPDLLELEPTTDAAFNIALLNGRPFVPAALQPINRNHGLHFNGWFLLKDKPRWRLAPHYTAVEQPMVALCAQSGGKRFIASIHHREIRNDVAAAMKLKDGQKNCGFVFDSDISNIDPGLYTLELLSPHKANPRRALLVKTGITLLIG